MEHGNPNRLLVKSYAYIQISIKEKTMLCMHYAATVEANFWVWYPLIDQVAVLVNYVQL